MTRLDSSKLLDASKTIFSTGGQIEILAHAALAFCNVNKGGLAGFSSKVITEGVNQIFPADEPVAEYNVKRFILRATIDPGDKTLVSKIGAYVIDQCLNDKNVGNHPVILGCIEMYDFVRVAKLRLADHPPQEPMQEEQNRLFHKIMDGLRNVTQHPDADDIYLQFFREPRNLNYSDVCYFLSYRYSLTLGKMIKTFVSISTPAFNGNGIFEYRHVHRFLNEQQGRRIETLRVSRGILVGIDKNYYFLGAAVFARGVAATSPIYPEGIQIIALEKEQFRHPAPGLSALFITNSNEMRPMVGRSALIPLGRKRDVGKQTFRNFDLDVFEDNKLDATVRADLGRIQGLRIDISEAVQFISYITNLEHINLENVERTKLLDLLKRPTALHEQRDRQDD